MCMHGVDTIARATPLLDSSSVEGDVEEGILFPTLQRFCPSLSGDVERAARPRLAPLGILATASTR